MQLEIVLKKVYRCVVIFCGCVVMACGCVVENTDLVVYYIKAAYYMGIQNTFSKVECSHLTEYSLSKKNVSI